ncbi:MAG: pantoate--beta-alanine ligase [Gemmatimonadetes bacterium]|nr:pantoate--beta-alanine ligase [Gemmatimonadota bacterium]
MRAWSRAARADGRRVGFVPTMGFLHEGHLRLVDRAATGSDTVAMSIFVNPLQFGPQEDLGSYPRALERDRQLATSRGVDCLFVPADQAMYPRPPLVRVSPGTLTAHLCGPWRPGHFEGVLTVVAKLFHIVEPDLAVFGRKDLQQARIIRSMVDDLNFPVTIEVASIIREADGLALSSRNAYLKPVEREVAVLLSQALEEGHRRYRGGTHDAREVVAAVRQVLSREATILVQYVEAVDPDTLAPVTTATDDTVLALAAFIGKTRLIDNIILGVGLGADERLAATAGTV